MNGTVPMPREVAPFRSIGDFLHERRARRGHSEREDEHEII